MPLSFPQNPTVGQTYTSGPNTWQFDGERWRASSSGATGATGPPGATGVGTTGATGATGPQVSLTSVSSSITPAVNVTYDLGSSSQRWRDLYLSGNSINLGGALITASNNSVVLPSGSRIGNVVIGSGSTTVTVSNTAPTTASLGSMWVNSDTGDLTIYFGNSWASVGGPVGPSGATGATGPRGLTGLTGPSSGIIISEVVYPDSAQSANIGGGTLVTVTGNGFETGLSAYFDKNLCTIFGAVSSNAFTITTPALSSGEYHLFVYNPSGTNGVKPVGIRYSLMPQWITANGTLVTTNLGQNLNLQLQANSDSTVTYSLTSGLLPLGITLSNTGLISGNVGSTDNIFSFLVRASNPYNLAAIRDFNIKVVTGFQVQYLVVAGGGSGGYFGGGGGGAGGFRTNVPGATSGRGAAAEPTLTLSTLTNYVVTVGAGGSNNSTFGNITSLGGGYGDASPGGSGGGTPRDANATSGALGTAGQGYNGGWTPGTGWRSSSGGGGAGGNGGNGGGNGTEAGEGNGGAGGPGQVSSITGSAVYYAGGGGGQSQTKTGGSGGIGGGGAGATQGGCGINATANTGGGGGGGGSQGGGGCWNGGTGGSGVVILRYSSFLYLVADPGLTSDTVTINAGEKYTRFTAGTGNVYFSTTAP